MESNPLKLIIAGIVGVCLLVLSLATYYRVEQYERVVVTKFGKVIETSDPGLHFRMPFVHSLHTCRTDMQQYANTKTPANTYTIDNQEVDIIFTIFYNVPADKCAFVYENSQGYESLLANIAWDRLKSAMGQVNATHVAEKRGEIRAKVREAIRVDATPMGINVTDVQLTNLEFTKSYRSSVEAAAKEKAGIDQREYERQQAEKRAQTAKIDATGKADAAREAAKGEADAIDFKAKAEARAIQVKGEAQAAAMKAQANALSANPVLVEMKKAEQWNGALPTAIYAGAPIPFMNVAK